MQAFLKKLTLFLLPIFALLLVTEFCFRKIDTSYSEKEKGLLLNQKKIELLILGNSHACYDVDPNQFDLYTYNLANVNQSLYFDKRIVLKHLDSLPNLKYVLICIDYHSFCFSTQGARDVWSYYGNGIPYKDHLSFWAKHSRLCGYTLKVGINLAKKTLSQKYKTIKAVDVEEGVILTNPISKGWFSFKGTNWRMMDTTHFLDRATYFNQLVKKSTEKAEIINDLEDFIVKLKERNITPILVTTPCLPAYSKLLNQEAFNNNQQEVLNLSHKYQVQYWNYFDLPLDKSLFYNCDHLNRNGAAQFSKIINQRIETSLNGN